MISKRQTHSASGSLARGIFLVGALTAMNNSTALENPFSSTDLAGGYQIAEQEKNTGKTSEGNCGAGKSANRTEAEAVCGIYRIGSAHRDDSKVVDGKCGGHKVVEALCGDER